MSEDGARRTIEVDDEFLEELYGLVGKIPPGEKGINVDLLKDLLLDIKRKIDRLQTSGGDATASQERASVSGKIVTKDDGAVLETDETAQNPAKQILIIDDLGVITYQLKVLLSQFDYDIDCSQEIYDAVNKYKKRKYEYVVMDLFIPTEREGFILLTEMKKLAAAAGVKTTIGVITASPRKEIEQQCKARGADFFLEKNSDWQSALYGIMDGYINSGKDDEDDY